MPIGNTQRIEVDMNSPRSFETFYIKQYDKNSRTLEIALTDNGVDYIIPIEAIAKIHASYGNIVVLDEICTYSENIVTTILKDSFSCTDCELQCEIELFIAGADSSQDQRFQSSTFKINVQKSNL